MKKVTYTLAGIGLIIVALLGMSHFVDGKVDEVNVEDELVCDYEILEKHKLNPYERIWVGEPFIHFSNRGGSRCFSNWGFDGISEGVYCDGNREIEIDYLGEYGIINKENRTIVCYSILEYIYQEEVLQ